MSTKPNDGDSINDLGDPDADANFQDEVSSDDDKK